MKSWKVLEKSWIFLSVREWEPCVAEVYRGDFISLRAGSIVSG